MSHKTQDKHFILSGEYLELEDKKSFPDNAFFLTLVYLVSIMMPNESN